ncbi:MAG: Rab family GTPase [Candidatus Heimdallarchaeaceae archaeon]
MSDIKREFVFKVVLMGEGSVGKTSIRSQFMGVGFKSEYIKTIGADFASKAIILGDNKVHFQIWDLAGQAMYKHVRSSFYSGCKCGFLVCDLTSPETLEKLDQWVEEAVEHSGGFLKIFIILGNKHDLVDKIKVKQEDIDKLLEKIKKMKGIDSAYLQTSALTGENISEAFNIMGKMFLEKEGFPRNGARTEGEELSENSPPFSVKPLPMPPKIETDEPKKEHMNQLFSTLTMLNEKITSLSEIMTALEERMLVVETKRFQIDNTNQEINSLKEKIESIDKEMLTVVDSTEAYSQPKDDASIDLDLMVPLPPMEDFDSQKDSDEKASYEVIDRSKLDTMHIIEGNNNEESITEILSETEPELEPVEEEQKPEKVKSESKKKKRKGHCPKCGSKLSFIKQYNRWYCYRCKIYV